LSKYFQALNRISQQTKPVKKSPAAESTRGEPEARETSSGNIADETVLVHESAFSSLPSAKRNLAYSALLDTLRAVSVTSGVPCVVLAGVSRRSPSTQVLKGMLTQAENQGLRLLSLKVAFEGSRRFLRENSLESLETNNRALLPDKFEENQDSQLFGSMARSSSDQVEQWLERVDRDFDLALIQGPALNESVEAALLARETSGLVLIAENLVDSHVDLVAATEKVRDAGCTLLGVVLVGAREWLPSWLRRLFKGRSSPTTSRT